jgi:hypothetical protein
MITSKQYTIAPATSAESKVVTRMEKPKLKTFQFDTVRVVEDNHLVSGQLSGLRRKHPPYYWGPSFVFWDRGFYHRW